jgi:hypothetical protein
MFACVFVHMWVCQLHVCVSVDVFVKSSRENVSGGCGWSGGGLGA